MRIKTLATALCLAASVASWPVVTSADELNVVVDNLKGQWKVFTGLEIPQLTTADGKVKPLREKPDLQSPKKEEDRKVVEVKPGPKPPEGWKAPDFDDDSWPRQTGTYGLENGGENTVDGKVVVENLWDPNWFFTEYNPAHVKTLCLRGPFEVTDPAQAPDLYVTVEYHGGVVVSINGTEIKRASLPAGSITLDTPAEAYGKDAYVKPEIGTLAANRTRKTEARIKSNLLRKGVNVVAIEVHRAAVSDILDNPAMKVWGLAFVRRATIRSEFGMTKPTGAKALLGGPDPYAEMAGQVLNSHYGNWRCFSQWRTVETISGKGVVRPLRNRPDTKKGEAYDSGPPVPVYAMPAPPAEWIQPEFDDSPWARTRGEFGLRYRAYMEGNRAWDAGNAAEQALIAVRGKFRVDDPAKCRDLEVLVDYVGGVAVYINGKELKRGHLPEGKLLPETPATPYPMAAYIQPNGTPLPQVEFDHPKHGDLIKTQRARRLKAAIPASMLRKGVNVVALEAHRAPMLETALNVCPWGHVGVLQAAVRSAGGDASASGATPNLRRTEGPQLWIPSALETVTAYDYADPCEPLGHLSIVGVRNGTFSARLVLSSEELLKNVRVTVTEPVSEKAAKLAAAAFRIRYAEPAVREKSWAPAIRFEGLQEQAPVETPTRAAPWTPGAAQLLRKWVSQEHQVHQAVLPIWVTARVPADAAPGVYEGQVAVEADEATTIPPNPISFKVPLRIRVIGWALPDPKDFRVRNMGFLMTEGLATYYKEPLWTDRHFKLMGKSLSLMAEIGSRQAVLNLCEQFCDQENRESMVRWIKAQKSDVGGQKSGSVAPDAYTYDFTVADKYLEMVATSIGKPDPLRVNPWGTLAKDEKTGQLGVQSGKAVSLLDLATGKLSSLEQPLPKGEAGLAFSKPMLDELKKRLDQRGWFDVAAVGDTQYAGVMHPESSHVLMAIWPNTIGANTSHPRGSWFHGTAKDEKVHVRYCEAVWGEGSTRHRGYTELLDPARHWRIACGFARTRHRDASSLHLYRQLPEEEIMRGMDGLGPLGGDLWPLPDSRGNMHNVSGQSSVGPGCSTKAILAPGSDGAIATERFEMFREGMQLAEAVLFLQRALNDNKLAPELAERANRLLEERSNAFLRTRGLEGYLALIDENVPIDRDAELYETAAAVAKALGK